MSTEDIERLVERLPETTLNEILMAMPNEVKRLLVMEGLKRVAAH